MSYRSPRETAVAAFDKARRVGKPPRFQTDRYLVMHMVAENVAESSALNGTQPAGAGPGGTKPDGTGKGSAARGGAVPDGGTPPPESGGVESGGPAPESGAASTD